MGAASATTPILGLTPQIQTDETLSSFVLRLARNQSAIPHELCSLVWPGLQFWPRDIDRTASSELVKHVAIAIQRKFSDVWVTTLHDLVDGMGHPSSKMGIQQGILPVGVYHRKRRRYGQQYCPECLKINPPYLRRSWRLEFVSACSVHGRRLLDSCPNCDTPFVPHRFASLIERRCNYCHGSLIDVQSGLANSQAFQLQNALTGLLHGQNDVAHPFRRISTSNHELFDGVRRLCRLLSYSADGHGLQPRRLGLRWDSLRVVARERVLGYVGVWLSDWPTSFRAWAEEFKVSQERMESVGPWPQWVATEISHCPSRPRTRKRSAALSIAALKREFGQTAAYRMARAKLLLDRAGKRRAGA